MKEKEKKMKLPFGVAQRAKKSKYIQIHNKYLLCVVKRAHRKGE